MQIYLNTTTGKYHQYDADVVLDIPAGTWSTSSGAKGTCPTTLVPYTGPWPIPPTLAESQSSQIALLQSAFQKAEQAPVSITLVSGVTPSFGMTPHDWVKIVGLYSKYVAKGVALPSGYQIPDVNGVLQSVTVTDIENLFDAGETQMTGAIAKLASLVAQVQSATTVSAVQAIVW